MRGYKDDWLDEADHSFTWLLEAMYFLITMAVVMAVVYFFAIPFLRLMLDMSINFTDLIVGLH